jgi:hypothetical protein
VRHSKPLLTIAAAAAVILVVLFWSRVFKTIGSHQSESARNTFTRDVNNDKRITVRGWQPDQIESLLQEFANEHGTVFVDTGPGSTAGSTLLTFPRDIHPKQFLSMVNFLTYAKGHDARGALAVIGKATLNASFGLPDPVLVGRKAFIYVPEDDQDHDVVYVEVVGEGIYAVGLTKVRWKRADSPRQPAWVHKL